MSTCKVSPNYEKKIFWLALVFVCVAPKPPTLFLRIQGNEISTITLLCFLDAASLPSRQSQGNYRVLRAEEFEECVLAHTSSRGINTHRLIGVIHFVCCVINYVRHALARGLKDEPFCRVLAERGQNQMFFFVFYYANSVA